MEDLEFSVEICDRDWKCFLEVCEECDLCPPLLATLDDSGLSESDQTNSTLEESAVKFQFVRHSSEADFKSLDVETHLGEQVTSGMESILLDSKEDPHLQSAYMFFEGITNQQVNDPAACSSKLKTDSSAHSEPFIKVSKTKTNEKTLHKSDDLLNRHKLHWGVVGKKSTSTPYVFKRMRRKKKRLSVKSTQGRHETNTDVLVTTMVRCGNPFQYKSRYQSRLEEHNSDLMHLQCFNNPILEDQLNLEDSRPKDQASTEKAEWDDDGGDEDDDDDMDDCQGDTLSAVKSILAVEALHSTRDKHTGSQRQAKPQQQLETEIHNMDQNSYDSILISHAQKSTFPNTELQMCETTLPPMDEIFENTGSVASRSNENIASSCSSSSPTNEVNRSGSTMPKPEEGDHDTGQLIRDLKAGHERLISTSCEPDNVLDSQHPVSIMSSFWKEMEKLTINDIIGLRRSNEEMAQNSCFAQSAENKPLPTGEDCGHFQSFVLDPDCTSLKCELLLENVENENDPVDLHPRKETTISFNDSTIHGSPPKGLRKISKNISVQNLRALDSVEPNRHAKQCQFVQTSELENSLPSKHCDTFTIPIQSPTDDINFNIDGNSVPETYDYFFAQFDIENFFYPFVTKEEHTKLLQVVPGQRNLYLPETYDYFFASSSDDSAEEEEEYKSSPMRVVSRRTQKSTATKTFTDNYENFFCDSDMRQNFFWTATFSFRNVRLTRGAVRNRRSSPSTLVHTRKNAQFLCDLERMDHTDLIMKQKESKTNRSILEQPLGYADIQRAVPDPRTDVSLLPLRQSDMCLVCIAFASWVLKTANPQTGEMWKAVLLANVSALSAIRYLRKYIKVEVAAGQRKEHFNTISGGT